MIVTDDTPAQALAIDAAAFVRQEVTFAAGDVDMFAALSHDRASLHFDDGYAIARGYPGRIVHGLLIGARFSRLMGMFLPGEDSVIQSLNLQFRRPVSVGTRVTLSVEVEKIVEAVGAVVLKLSATADGVVLVEGRAQCVLCWPPADVPARSR
jgi:3-hydroxybutyryl-CoA dehydratase